MWVANYLQQLEMSTQKNSVAEQINKKSTMKTECLWMIGQRSMHYSLQIQNRGFNYPESMVQVKNACVKCSCETKLNHFKA